MSSTTEKLALFKYDPSTDGAQTFNIQKALNDNWDRLDDAVKEILITLANKAPAGFGLGSEYTSYIADFNACIKNGWYRAYSNSLNYPSIGGLGARYGALLVLTRDSTIYHVYYVALYSVMYTIERYSNDGGTTWSEWEFVNPPMELGVEYRTTERYLGKPVYVKAVDCGAMANNKTIVITDDSKRILDVILKGNPTLFPMGPNGSGLGAWDGCFTAGGTQITLYAGDSLAASNHAAVAIAKLIDA
mgnify:CR=1 FL=1